MSGVPLSSCLHHSHQPSLGTHPTCASGFQLLLVHRLIEGKECLFANEPEKTCLPLLSRFMKFVYMVSGKQTRQPYDCLTCVNLDCKQKNKCENSRKTNILESIGGIDLCMKVLKGYMLTKCAQAPWDELTGD